MSVPAPGTADIARLVKHQRREAGLTQAVEKVQAGKPRPNHRGAVPERPLSPSAPIRAARSVY